MRSAIAILIDECGGIEGAIKYAERMALNNGPLSSEYAGYALTLHSMRARREDAAERRLTDSTGMTPDERNWA